RQVTARRQAVEQRVDDRGRLFVAADVAQDAQQHERYRFGEVENLGGGGQDARGVAQIGIHVGGNALGTAGQQGAGVREHDRVVVDVDDPARGGDPLRDLMGVVRRWQPGADI